MAQFAQEQILGGVQLGYPGEYERHIPLLLEEQARRFADLFRLPQPEGLPIPKEPPGSGMERWVVLPRWQMVVSAAGTYGTACYVALEILSRTRPFVNILEEQFQNDESESNFSYGNLALTSHTKEMLDACAADPARIDRTGNFMLVPIQFGARHRARSLRFAHEMLVPGEFGLDLFSVVCLLLMSPSRLDGSLDTLWIDCLGTTYTEADPLVPLLYPHFTCFKREKGEKNAGRPEIGLSFCVDNAYGDETAVPTGYYFPSITSPAACHGCGACRGSCQC